jgi:maltose alpha-D-glucosyltransferase/alpha-amylase
LKGDAAAAQGGDPLWYKDAVVYELHIKAYADGNGDGIGDFRGLTAHLDHVQTLGVNTVWLLPFYPSPLRDDGYDVADYENVHPSYGTLDDFRAFVAEAHRRGLRVITELVVNHTSDQHPWFQAARRAPKGSAERNFYVWSDDPRLYSGTRIIFTDTEKSNWTWDEVAGQYFWHRFFSHQPDLNFDNPAVLEAVLGTMAFWLEMGVDGFRLDAIPYLIERDGTSNENLRETHEVIKAIRRRIDEQFPGRLLLAEANMWPEDVREYFGDGDECQMAYHFPLMPRMYMAIALEDRHPVVEILAQTPDIPANCQWAIFLRNHDELTLEMVTSKERDYLYSMYASDARARINLGIRRRLAPLLENDQERIKLMNSLLLSMPGTPVLYYGDEIGMGDNIFLGDRDGVRTPMQWSSDRNGGFSRSDPQRLYLPPIQDPVYGFEAVNVEAQAREVSSLLSWTRRLLAVRAGSRAFGRGSFNMLHPGNRKVLAYVREHEGEAILCVANLSRVAQPVELGLGAWKGRVPVEMLGRSSFPPIGDLPYMLTLPAHGFFWFRLTIDAAPPRWHTDRLPVDDMAVVVLFDGWNSFFRNRVVPWRIGLAERTRTQLERELLPAFLRRQRWLGSHADAARSARLGESVCLQSDGRVWLLALVALQPGAGNGRSAADARYFLPLAVAFDDEDEDRVRALAAAALSKVRQQARMGVLADAMADEAFCRAVVQGIASHRVVKGEGGSLHFRPGRRCAEIVGDALAGPTPIQRVALGRHSASLVGERLFLKAYRRVEPGPCPELDMGCHLHEVLHYPNSVAVAGSVEFHASDGTTWTLALLQARVTHQGDAWTAAVNQCSRLLESPDGALPASDGDLVLVDRFELLALRVAELHVALARRTGDAAFDPEPVAASDLQAWGQAVRMTCRETLALLHTRAGAWPPPLAEVAARVAREADSLLRIADEVAAAVPGGVKSRLHGDLHLGQVLVCRDDFCIVDFEGEPGRSVFDRCSKHSALRDVACLVQSIERARRQALQVAAQVAGDAERLAPLARRWQRRVRRAFLAKYFDLSCAAGLWAGGDGPALARQLLRLFELESVLRRLRRGIDNDADDGAAGLAAEAALAELAELAEMPATEG